MRGHRKTLIARAIGGVALVSSIATLAMLSKPQWREYFAEVGSVVGALIVVRAIVDRMRGRFQTERSSQFERALRVEFSSQKSPSQLVKAISMAASPEKSTFDLLAIATEHRLQDRYGFGLDDDKARHLLGSEVFDLLHLTRRTGPSWALKKNSPRWAARLSSVISQALRRRSVNTASPENPRNPRNPRNSPDARSASIEQVRTILTGLEKL
jgi:hypothetical protein